MARYKQMDNICPMAGFLTSLARPWTLHILWALRDGQALRFGVLRRQIPGISARMLTQRLRQMEEDGFVLRRVVDNAVPEVYYSISHKMQALQSALDDMHKIALEHDA